MIDRSRHRQERVARAVNKRISAMGDMSIRVHRLTIAALIRWASADGTTIADHIEHRQESFDEVPAYLLEMLTKSGFLYHGDRKATPRAFDGLMPMVVNPHAPPGTVTIARNASLTIDGMAVGVIRNIELISAMDGPPAGSDSGEIKREVEPPFEPDNRAGRRRRAALARQQGMIDYGNA